MLPLALLVPGVGWDRLRVQEVNVARWSPDFSELGWLAFSGFFRNPATRCRLSRRGVTSAARLFFFFSEFLGLCIVSRPRRLVSKSTSALELEISIEICARSAEETERPGWEVCSKKEEEKSGRVSLGGVGYI